MPQIHWGIFRIGYMTPSIAKHIHLASSWSELYSTRIYPEVNRNVYLFSCHL